MLNVCVVIIQKTTYPTVTHICMYLYTLRARARVCVCVSNQGIENLVYSLCALLTFTVTHKATYFGNNSL